MELFQRSLWFYRFPCPLSISSTYLRKSVTLFPQNKPSTGIEQLCERFIIVLWQQFESHAKISHVSLVWQCRKKKNIYNNINQNNNTGYNVLLKCYNCTSMKKRKQTTVCLKLLLGNKWGCCIFVCLIMKCMYFLKGKQQNRFCVFFFN